MKTSKLLTVVQKIEDYLQQNPIVFLGLLLLC